MFGYYKTNNIYFAQLDIALNDFNKHTIDIYTCVKSKKELVCHTRYKDLFNNSVYEIDPYWAQTDEIVVYKLIPLNFKYKYISKT